MDSKREEGFSLVELLVVVVILGVILAITIPSYLDQRRAAMRTSARSDVRNVAVQVEDHYASFEAYPATQADFDALLVNNSVVTSEGVVRVGTVAPGLTYTLLADGYCVSAGHRGISGGTQPVASFRGPGNGLMATPTIDCS